MSEDFISQEEFSELASLMNRKHSSILDGRLFSLKGHTDGQGVHVEVLLKNEDETYYYPVHARIDHDQEELSSREAAMFLADFIDLYFEDYFDEGETVFLPIDWTDFQYDAVSFQMKGQVLNQQLEKMADKLLSNHNLET